MIEFKQIGKSYKPLGLGRQISKEIFHPLSSLLKEEKGVNYNARKSQQTVVLMINDEKLYTWKLFNHAAVVSKDSRNWGLYDLRMDVAGLDLNSESDMLELIRREKNMIKLTLSVEFL